MIDVSVLAVKESKIFALASLGGSSEWDNLRKLPSFRTNREGSKEAGSEKRCEP
jgi:hypothetical protein